jgi:hypothetical protein
MKLNILLERILPTRFRKIQRGKEQLSRYASPENVNVLSELKSKFGFEGDLANIFSQNKGLKVHKWHHYIPLYDYYLGKFRGTDVRFLEIGVSRGGSLAMWREYFGPTAVIFGIDIDPECGNLEGIDAQIRIGSQDDPVFMESIIREMGGLDIVLDDGSHRMEHVNKSLRILFPRLSDGGVYFIEDLHTAYWPSYQGGYYSRKNFFRTVRILVNDIHSWYHPFGKKLPEVTEGLDGIHIHDSIVVLNKARKYPPKHSLIGSSH